MDTVLFFSSVERDVYKRQPWFCGQGITYVVLKYRMPNGQECQVLGFGQAVVALRQLLIQHLAILDTDGIEAVLLERDTDTLYKAFSIGTQVRKGNLKVNGAVKEIQENAPLIEDGSLISVSYTHLDVYKRQSLTDIL